MPDVTTHRILSGHKGQCYVEIDIDNNLRVRKGRVVNDSDKTAYFTIKKAGEVAFSEGIMAHDSIERNLPASVKLKAIEQPNTDDDGPISMGNIEMSLRCG